MNTSGQGMKGSRRILVASRSFGPNCPEAVELLRAHGCEVVWPFERKPSEEELLAVAPGYDAVISGTEKITARVIDACPRLKVISKHGVGVENIDVVYAKSKGITVCLAEDSITDAVADMTWAMILGISRQLVVSHNDIKAGGWRRLVGVQLSGRTLGIVGLGHIGKAVVRRAAGFRMRVVALDLVRDAEFARQFGVSYVERDELLAESDVVSLHLNVTPRTRNMVNADFLSKMKKSAYLINCSRGELVDEDALFTALQERRIAGAALDVFVKEPPVASPLLSLDNVIATAHLGGQTDAGLRKMGEVTAMNTLRVLEGSAPLYAV